MCTRGGGEKKREWPNHWTMNLVSVAFAGPFITLDTVILGTPGEAEYKQQTYGSSSRRFCREQKPDSPTCKVSICSPYTAQQQKSSITQYTVKPTLTVIPCDSLYLTQACPLDALQLFSAATIVSRINASDGALRYFPVFPNYILPVFHIVSQLYKLVVCSASARDGAAHGRAGEERGWVYWLFMCVCPKDQKEKTSPQ